MIHSFRWTSEAADVELGASHSNKSESNRVMWAPQKKQIYIPFGKGLYIPFMVILGMVYYWAYYISGLGSCFQIMGKYVLR